MRLINYDRSRDNNFNLIRFFSAFLVLFSHHFVLTNTVANVEPFAYLGMTLGGIAVDVFFITSGLLITAGYYASKNLLSFARARVLRIYPALIISVLFCILVVGPIFTQLPLNDYFSDPLTLKFLKRNSLLINDISYNLPGTFTENHVKNAVNGSLWSLPYEVKMYAILPFILILTGIVSQQLNITWFAKYFVLLLTITAVLIDTLNQHNGVTDQFTRLFSLFFIGVTFYLWRHTINLSWKIFCLCFLVLILASNSSKYFSVAYLFCLPYLLIFLAYIPSGFIRNFNNIGDYSYGIYIYAFPVQQSLVAMKLELSGATIFLLTCIITLTLAVISWHCVEKPALKFKNRASSVGHK